MKRRTFLKIMGGAMVLANAPTFALPKASTLCSFEIEVAPLPVGNYTLSYMIRDNLNDDWVREVYPVIVTKEGQTTIKVELNVKDFYVAEFSLEPDRPLKHEGLRTNLVLHNPGKIFLLPRFPWGRFYIDLDQDDIFPWMSRLHVIGKDR